jgi:hypothetical protein
MVNGNHLYGCTSNSIYIIGDDSEVWQNTILDGNPGNVANISGILIDGNRPRIGRNHIENLSGGSGHLKYGIRCNNSDRPRLEDGNFALLPFAKGYRRGPQSGAGGRYKMDSERLIHTWLAGRAIIL